MNADFSEKNRKALKRKYERKLKALFSDVDDTKQQAAGLLVSRAAFLLASLDELEEILYRRGFVEEYQNGAEQSGLMVSPALKSYKINAGQLMDIFRQLKDFLPESAPEDALSSFLAVHSVK